MKEQSPWQGAPAPEGSLTGWYAGGTVSIEMYLEEIGAWRITSDFFVLLEDQIRVDDLVQLAGRGGLVEPVNVRNGSINISTSMARDYSPYVFVIGVAYREDVTEAGVRPAQDRDSVSATSRSAWARTSAATRRS